jgi:predicted Zn finger-like uncharacterized protein
VEQLATRCPHCQTSFRVTMAQLELRAGKVRCGSCREIFNGIDHVFEHGGDEDFALSPPPASSDPSDRMTLIDFGSLRGMPAAPSGPSMQDELDALSRAIADLQSKPWAEPPASPQSEFADDDHDCEHEARHDASQQQRDAAADHAAAAPASATATERYPEPESEPEPAFVRQARRRQRGRRLWAVLLWVGIPVLLVALAGQLLFHFRHDIAARYSATAPYLRAACAELGCTIRLPKDIDQLSLASSRLDAVAGSGGGDDSAAGADSEAVDGLPRRFVLVALLRNQSASAQAWPSLDLQLKDAEGKLLVRRAFLPNQYAKADEFRDGMPARSEREIRLPFELAGAAPAGFELTIFHH